MTKKREEEEDKRGGQRKSRSRQTAVRCGKEIRRGKKTDQGKGGRREETGEVRSKEGRKQK